MLHWATHPESLARRSVSGELIKAQVVNVMRVLLVLSQLGWFNCQDVGKWNHVRVVYWPWDQGQCPEGCQESLQFQVKGSQEWYIHVGSHTSQKSVGGRLVLKSSLHPGDRAAILKGLCSVLILFVV